MNEDDVRRIVREEISKMVTEAGTLVVQTATFVADAAPLVPGLIGDVMGLIFGGLGGGRSEPDAAPDAA